jgi:hypothetical protein
LQGLPAGGAKPRPRRIRSALRRQEGLLRIKGLFAAVTHQQYRSALDGDERDEEQTEIVIDALEACLSQPALRTQPWGLIHDYRPGLDPADEEEHHTSKKLLKRKSSERET